MLRHFGVFFSAMKVRHVRWLLFTVLPILLVLDFVTSPRVVGMSEQWSNDQYRFAGGTAPLGLAIGALVFGLYLLLMYADPAELGPPFSGVFRRFVAFWMDFIVAMTVMAPVLGVIVALIEWRRTGVFQWAFERETQAPDDRILAPAGTALVAVAVVFYYALPLLRRRPSPGACIAGYQVIPDDGVTMTLRTALLRTLLGFIALCVAYLAPFIQRDSKNGKFWLDKVFGTRAVTWH